MLNAFYKIITSCIQSIIEKHCDNNNIIAEGQKGCRKGSLGCKEQLVIDSVIMGQASKKKRNLYTCFIDYKKEYDMVPHQWLVRVLRIYKIDDNVIRFLESLMKKWCTTFTVTSEAESLTSDKLSIKRGIFQGDTLSPYWFCLALNPLSVLLNDEDKGFVVKKGMSQKQRISHLAYMDDFKLYAESSAGIETVISITEEFSNDIRMELGIDKCKIQAIHKGKLTQQQPYETASSELITSLEANEFYKYLGYTQNAMIDHTSTKKTLKEEFVNRVRAILRTSLNAKNTTKAINTYAVPVITYSLGIIKWSNTDIEDLQRVVRVLLTRARCHHPKAAMERVDTPRQLGGRGICNLSNLRSRIINGIRKFFYEKAAVSPIHKIIVAADENHTPLNLDLVEMNLRSPTLHEKIETWKRKAMHGRYPAEISDAYVDSEWSLKWLTIGYLFPETEGFIIAIQDQVIATKNYKKYVIKDPTVLDDRCRLCGQGHESIQHIIAGCNVLAPTAYKERHDNVGRIIHLALAEKFKLVQNQEPYYKYQPSNVLENDSIKMYWDRGILTDRTVQHDRPDITILFKNEKKVLFLDFTIVLPNNLQSAYEHKIQKYTQLAQIVKEQWHVNSVQTIPIVMSATGIVPKNLKTAIKDLGLKQGIIIQLQKAVILATTTLVRKVIGEM